MAIQRSSALDVPADLRDTFAQIDEYQNLGPNWDGEDALPVERSVALRAKSLLRLAADAAGSLGLRWEQPAVTPNPDGGIELTWEIGSRWALLIVGPGTVDIGSSTQENDAESCYRPLSVDNAVEAILWALRGC